jgi:hypothetical protein
MAVKFVRAEEQRSLVILPFSCHLRALYIFCFALQIEWSVAAKIVRQRSSVY